MNLVRGADTGLPGVMLLYELGWLERDPTKLEGVQKLIYEAVQEQLRSLVEERVWKDYRFWSYDLKTGAMVKEPKIEWCDPVNVKMDVVLAAVSQSQKSAEAALIKAGFKRIRALTKVPNWNYHGQHQVTMLMLKYKK